jgi:hypothetical protein
MESITHSITSGIGHTHPLINPFVVILRLRDVKSVNKIGEVLFQRNHTYQGYLLLGIIYFLVFIFFKQNI